MRQIKVRWVTSLVAATSGAIAVALAMLASAGCVDKAEKPQKKIDPAYIKAHLLSAPPATLTNRVDADLGGKVIYLGNEVVGGTTIGPGSKVTVKHYWKVVQAPGTDWRVFSHVTGAAKEWMNVDHSDMRVGYGPDHWQAGDIVEDVQELTLKKDWKSPTALLAVGLYRKGGQTTADRMPIVHGPGKEGAVEAVTFHVDVSRKPGEIPPYVVRRADGPIAIDGKADEAAWKGAPSSPVFETAEGSPALSGETTAKLLWDDQNLYAFITVADKDVFSEFSKDDDTLWKADVVELFIDADKNRRGYVELQVNPNNAKLDSWFATTRAQQGDESWSAGMTSAVAVHGTANNREDVDQGWDVEIAIPLAAVKGKDDAMKVAIPPAIGDTWRLNVVRVDKPKDAKSISAGSWSQISYQDFHALDRMLTVSFGDATGATKAASEVGEAVAADGDAAPGAAVKAPAGAAKGAGADAPKAGGAEAPKGADAAKPLKLKGAAGAAVQVGKPGDKSAAPKKAPNGLAPGELRPD